jgi:REP element-mobilizing transposase RayT
MAIYPKFAISIAVESIKKNISRAFGRKFNFLQRIYWDPKSIWRKGYFVSTIAINKEVIRRYI